MRRPLIIVTAAAAVLSAGVAAGPALAANQGPGAGPRAGTAACACDGTGTCATGTPGYQGGRGMGQHLGPATGRGMGPGAGMGWAESDPLAGLAKGTLTATQKAALADMAEEEKLAHDVYAALATSSGDSRFTRIAAAESRHLTAVRALLTRYGVKDPTAGKAEGVFASARFQQLYRDLVAKGDDSLDAALAVGRQIETADIADLAKASAGLTAPDVRTVYARLGMASQHHLRAFGG